MLRLIGLIVVALAIVAAIGWYRGWFEIQAHEDQGVHQVDVTVDNNKMEQDKETVKENVQQDVHTLEHR